MFTKHPFNSEPDSLILRPILNKQSRQMKFSMRWIVVIMGLIGVLSACQKEVHIDLSGTPPVVVVQGQIQTGQPPLVVLTQTLSFFSTIDLSTLQNSFVHNAVITVSDGSQTVTLREYNFDTGASYKFYIYSIDSTNHTTPWMLGQNGKSYTLTIKVNGATYTSVTRIPEPKGVDSMWFSAPLFKNKRTPDSAYQLFANYTDPDTLGNYVRSFTSINHHSFYANGLYDDEAVNGIKISNIAMFAGYQDSTNVQTDTVRYFFPGDTVTLNWCQIDKGTFTFWNTEMFAQRAIGNPFASPINVQTNIKGGAIGVWAGYASAMTTLVVP
jgi:Domain of unknown function (DUF4249)